MFDSGNTAHIEGCLHAHHLVNKLSVIIGNCDLLLESQGAADRSSVQRIEAIRGVAAALAEEAKEYACGVQSVKGANLLVDAVILGLSRNSSLRG